MTASIWDVQIFGGARPVRADEPVGFGVPQIAVGPDGPDADGPTVPLVYTRVGLASDGDGELRIIQSDGWHSGENVMGYGPGTFFEDWHSIRELTMTRHVEFESDGGMRCQGYEVRDDGVLVSTTWIISAAEPEDVEKERLRLEEAAYISALSELADLRRHTEGSPDFKAGLQAAWEAVKALSD